MLLTMHPSVPAPTVHGECPRLECLEPLRIEMSAVRHRQHDEAKRLELDLLRAQEGLAIKEGDDPLHEVYPLAHHQYQSGVARTAMVLPDPSTAKPALEEIEDLSPFRILADVELGHELEASSSARVPLNGYMKRAFAIDEASEVCIQPFLLIVRTDRIVTAHAGTLRRRCDMNEYRRILGVSSK